MSVRKYALFALFTIFAAGTALAQEDTTVVDTTVTDTTVTDTTVTDTTVTDTTGDSVTALKYGVRFSELGLRIAGTGYTVSLAAEGPITFKVLDVFGRTVWTQTVRPTGGVATANWRGVSSGGQPLGRGTYVLQAVKAYGPDRAPLGARTVLLGH